MSELPSGWGRVAIGEVAEVNPRPTTDPPSDDTLVSFVPMAACETETGRLDARGTRTFGELRRKSYRRFEEGDVVVAKITPSMENGKAALAKNLVSGQAFGTTEFHVLRPSNRLDPRYLLHFVLQHSFRAEAARHMTGTAGQLRVPADFLRQASMPLPPLDEQQRIVEAIDEQFSRLEAGIQSLRRAKRNLIRMQASVFETAVRGAIGGLSLPGSSWPMVPLAIALEELRYGTSTRCSYDGEGKPVLRIPNVRDGRVVLSDLKSAIDPDVDLSRVTVDEGDVLFIRTNGSRDLIGRTGVVTREAHGMAFASYLIGGRPSSELVSRFLWIVLSSPTWRRRIEGLAATSAGQYNISASSLKTIQIPLPPMRDQQEIVAEVDRQSTILGVVSDAIARAEARAHGLRRSVLREAFAGRLVSAEISLDVVNA